MGVSEGTLPDGIGIVCREDGSLFRLSRLRANRTVDKQDKQDKLTHHQESLSTKKLMGFPYLDSILPTKANIDAEVCHRISCSNAAFGRLGKRVFEGKDILVSAQMIVYKAVILTTLLYASESWTVYARHLIQIENHHRCLKRALRLTWEHKRTNGSILEEANCNTIESKLLKNQLGWSGHALRIPDSRLPKQLLFSQPTTGRR